MTTSYIGSILSALFVSSLIFALLLIKIITITVMETTTLMIKAVARELMDTMYVVCSITVAVVRALTDEVDVVAVPDSPKFPLGKRMPMIGSLVSLVLPVIFPQTTVCMANVHMLPLVGTSVQVTVVWLVVVGQLPQFDVRML